MSRLSDPAIVEAYNQEFSHALKVGIDKKYPNLSLVRLVGMYFKSKSGHVLDYGCGFGANLIHLLERGFTVSAVDTSPFALERVQQKLQHHENIKNKADLLLLDSEAETLPFDDASFDFLVCSSVLSLLSSPERIKALLSEFERVMRPGAKAYLDINGPISLFASKGRLEGSDVYAYQGRDGKGSLRYIYCPSTIEKFTALVEPYFIIDEVGYHAHSFFDSNEQEFIICCRKS